MVWDERKVVQRRTQLCASSSPISLAVWLACEKDHAVRYSLWSWAEYLPTFNISNAGMDMDSHDALVGFEFKSSSSP